MNINELKQIQDAPKTGWMLFYTRTEKLEGIETYSDLQEVQERLKDKEVLELHLFDKDREYRAIETKSKRYFINSAPGTIECLIPSEEEKQAEVYEEKVLMENAFCGAGHYLTMVNYLLYDEQGMVRVSNYRIKMGGVEDEL